MYHITVRQTFHASHALKLLDGTMEPIHHHDWHVQVTVGRSDLDVMETVMDFHVLESCLNEALAPWQDRHINEVEPFAAGQVNPTAERVAWWIAGQIAGKLPAAVKLVSVTVEEAPGCTATYHGQ
jgi:6-pyruvoyltetrahydropterin/6-carboxytetrahydropterin synthase